MQRVPGTRLIMLDCQPFMMRGVSYSPVPWGHDPSYHEPFGDYFTDEFHDIIKVRVRVGLSSQPNPNLTRPLTLTLTLTYPTPALTLTLT